MKLECFSAKWYRNLVSECDLDLVDYSVLVGQNNQGKSNLLRAINAAFGLIDFITTPPLRATMERITQIKTRSRTEPRIVAGYPPKIYNWPLDYPIEFQTSTPTGGSFFTPRFTLTGQEEADLSSILGPIKERILEVEVSVGSKLAHFKLINPAISGEDAPKKVFETMCFIADRFHVVYVPAVRTASQVNEIIKNLVASELGAVEQLPEYRAAVDQVIDLQTPILTKLSSKLEPTLREFFPSMQALEFDLSREARLQALRVVDTLIDDGARTSLASKGDGIQSLVAIALLRHINEDATDVRTMLLAIEEPEAHLHPAALHGLKKVLIELSITKQVIVSTHNAVFVSRDKPESNIIVSVGAIRRARNLVDIRDTLGIRVSDNLTHAAIILVVEGESDRVALGPILSNRYPRIAQSITEGLIYIDSTGGASKAIYRLNSIAAAMSAPICFFDNDQAGKQAGDAIIEAGLVDRGRVFHASLPGRTETELEDLYEVEIYKAPFAHYAVAVDNEFVRSRKKWADRTARLFARQGRTWDRRIEESLKIAIAQEAAASSVTCISESNLGPINALAQSLNKELDRLDEPGAPPFS